MTPHGTPPPIKTGEVPGELTRVKSTLVPMELMEAVDVLVLQC